MDLILYSRFSSSRLPGKALKAINNETLMGVLIKKIQKETEFRIILATSNDSSDDLLVRVAEDLGIDCFRGSLNNVADRTINCIKAYSIKSFARINGDSPFFQADLIKKGFNILKTQNLDFVTNLYPRSYPYGIAVEVFNANFFCFHASNFHYPNIEHITSFFYSNISRFKYHNILSNKKFDEKVILTVDDLQTYKVIRRMFEIDSDIQDKTIQEVIKIYKLAKKQISND